MHRETNVRQFIASLLICASGMYLVKSGAVSHFLSPSMTIVFSITIGIFTLMMVCETLRLCIRSRTEHHHHHHRPMPGWRYALLVVPFMSTTVIGNTALGAELFSQSSPGSASSHASLTPAVNYTVPSIIVPQSIKRLLGSPNRVLPTDAVTQADFAWYYNEVPALFLDRSYTMTGFVYHLPQSPGFFVMVRYGIWCCVADATPDGILVSASGESSLKDGQWGQVTGLVKKADIGNISSCIPLDWYVSSVRQQPVLFANVVRQIPQPAQTYLYPRHT